MIATLRKYRPELDAGTVEAVRSRRRTRDGLKTRIREVRCLLLLCALPRARANDPLTQP